MLKSLHPKAAYNQVYKDLYAVLHDVSVDALWYAQRMHMSIHDTKTLAVMEEHNAVVVADTNQLSNAAEDEVRHCMKLYNTVEALRLRMEAYWANTPEGMSEEEI